MQAGEPLRVEGRPLYAGVLNQGLPGDPVGDLFRAGDRLREYRGDSHTGAWISAGFDATEIGLLTELFIGHPDAHLRAQPGLVATTSSTPPSTG